MFAHCRRLGITVVLNLAMFSPGFGQDTAPTQYYQPFGGVALPSADDYYQPTAADLQTNGNGRNLPGPRRSTAVSTGITPVSAEETVSEFTPSFRIAAARPGFAPEPSPATVNSSSTWDGLDAAQQRLVPSNQRPLTVLGPHIITSPTGNMPQQSAPPPQAFFSGPPQSQLPAWLQPAAAGPRPTAVSQRQEAAFVPDRGEQVAPPFLIRKRRFMQVAVPENVNARPGIFVANRFDASNQLEADNQPAGTGFAARLTVANAIQPPRLMPNPTRGSSCSNRTAAVPRYSPNSNLLSPGIPPAVYHPGAFGTAFQMPGGNVAARQPTSFRTGLFPPGTGFLRGLSAGCSGSDCSTDRHLDAGASDGNLFAWLSDGLPGNFCRGRQCTEPNEGQAGGCSGDEAPRLNLNRFDLGDFLTRGRDTPWDFGGWFQSGYHENANGLFNNHPNRYNPQQYWLYAERAADPGNGLDWGFRFDALYGVDAQDTQAFGNPPGTWDFQNGFDYGIFGWAIPQLYFELATEELSVIVGHFFTFIGYEVIPAPDNFFYSHSYTFFNSEPFTHSGALATWNMNDQTTVYFGWSAGWDTGFDQFMDGNNFLGGFARTLNDQATLSYITTFGDFGFRGRGYSHSIVLDVAINDKLNYVLQSDLFTAELAGVSQDQLGVNQYLLYTLNDHWAVGARCEWWQDDGTSFNEATLGVNFRPNDSVLIRPEIRQDWSPANNLDFSTFAIDTIFAF